MPKLTLLERSSWVLAVLVCISSAFYLLNIAWVWYARNPTVIVTESTHSPIWDIPFPAVTVCDLNVASRSAALAKAESLIKLDNVTTEDVFGFFKYMSIMTSPFQITDRAMAYLSLLQDVLDLNNISISQLYTELSPSCMELIDRCSWKNTIYRCDLLFRKILTGSGYCCAFNYFATDQPAELAKLNELFLLNQPRRVASCGHLTALSFIINTRPSEYHSAIYASYGASVYVDDAYNFPDKNSPLRIITPNKELFIALSPEVTYATKGIANLAPEVRKCRFVEEVTPSNLKTYSYHNCLSECRVTYFEILCGCVPYNLPHNGSFKECNFRDLTCMSLGRNRDSNLTRIVQILKDRCGCVPDCEHIHYPMEITTGRLSRKASLNGKSFFKGIRLHNHSVVNVYFEDLVSIRYRRDVYLNFQNLVASFGGLLSLLLGFTLISFFDFIYFFSVRMLFDLFAKMKNYENVDQPRGILDKVNLNSDQLKPRIGTISYGHAPDNVPILRIKTNSLKPLKLQVKEAKDTRNEFEDKF